MRKYGSLLFFGLLAVLCFFFLYSAFGTLGKLQQVYPGWSARYDTKLTDNQVQLLKRYCAQNAETAEGVWPSFWTEEQESASTPRGDKTTDLFLYDGDPAQLFPVQLLSGSYPGELEENRCAVSSALSWFLWGSLDTVGQTLTSGGKSYTVSGVFAQEDFQLIRKGGPDTKWTATDLLTPKSFTREELEQLFTAAGFPQPDNLVDGSGIYSLTVLATYTPLILAALLALGLFFLIDRQGKKRRLKNWLLLGLLLLFGCAIPFLLQLVPAWLIPTKWSDFSFWSALGSKMQTYFNQWLRLVPSYRDMLAKQLLYAQALYITCALVLVPFLYYRLKAVLRENPFGGGQAEQAML